MPKTTPHKSPAPFLQLALNENFQIINQTKFTLGQTVPQAMTDEFVAIYRPHFSEEFHSAYACLAPGDDSIYFIFCTNNLDRLGTKSDATRQKFRAAQKSRTEKRSPQIPHKIGEQFLKIVPAQGLLSGNDLYTSARLRIAASGCCIAGIDLIPDLSTSKILFKKAAPK